MVLASNLNYPSINKYAQDVGEHYEIYDNRGYADIAGLLKRLGGKTELATNNISMLVEKEAVFTIYIPRFTSLRRDRFTIAHELGHYFLHYVYPGLQEIMLFRRGFEDRGEIEANFFAASLVMPTEQFKTQWEYCSGDARELSRIFNVSPRAAEIRAEVIGLTEDSTQLV